jgi:hypothetical protein
MSNTVHVDTLENFARICAEFTARGLAFTASVEDNNFTIEITGY